MSAPTSPSPSGLPEWASGAAAPPPTTGWARRRSVQVAIVVAVAAVLLIAVLDETGTYPFETPSGAGPGPYPTFDGAASEAQPAANSIAGGPWTVTAAFAARIPTPVEVPISNLTKISSEIGCNATALGALPVDVSVDATPASQGNGTSAFWLLVFTNASGGAVGVMVDLGSPTALFEATPAGCSAFVSDILPFPDGAPDSSTIVGLANGVGGTSFLADHPNSTQLFFGIGGVHVGIVISYPSWEIVYSSCPVFVGVNETGAILNVTVEGVTVDGHKTGSVACNLGTSLPVLPASPPATAAPAVGKAI